MSSALTSPRPSPVRIEEKYWTIYEVAELLKVSPATVTRMFQDRAGVVKLNQKKFLRGRRPHVTLRIPDSLLQAALRELAQ